MKTATTEEEKGRILRTIKPGRHEKKTQTEWWKGRRGHTRKSINPLLSTRCCLLSHHFILDTSLKDYELGMRKKKKINTGERNTEKVRTSKYNGENVAKMCFFSQYLSKNNLEIFAQL